jgi:hypothetical protein
VKLKEEALPPQGADPKDHHFLKRVMNALDPMANLARKSRPIPCLPYRFTCVFSYPSSLLAFGWKGGKKTIEKHQYSQFYHNINHNSTKIQLL